MFSKLTLFAIALSVSTAGFAAETTPPAAKKIRIGFSMDTLKEERWQHDRDFFVERAKELGAEVLVQAANGNDTVQNNQAENLLSQGVDILVVAPHNGVVAASIVNAAHAAGKKVIAYDRLIKNEALDMYLSFDNFEVGRLQAEYILKRAPKGNYLVIAGAPTDHNAKLFHDGEMSVLEPAAKRGDITIVADQWARDWLASEALKHTENALTKTNNNLVAVVAANDGTAGGAISALKQQGLAGKVLVSGQDAELAALQRVVEGTQAMTIYKPIRGLARRAAEIAVALAKGEAVATSQTVDNGKVKTPAVLLPPTAVDKDNVLATVVKDGYQKKEAIYQNVARKPTGY
jgi:D-xylose transport system substrate-binding protein